MSHCVMIETKLTDLEAVKLACKELGFEFRENQKTYAWWGSSVGDYPLPVGFTAEELGHCEHAIHIPGASYEIGLCKAKVGTGYVMLFDFFGQKTLLEKIGGEKAHKLLQSYSVNKTELEMKRKGYQTRREVTHTGAVNVRIASARW